MKYFYVLLVVLGLGLIGCESEPGPAPALPGSSEKIGEKTKMAPRTRVKIMPRPGEVAPAATTGN